ncbi:MAG: hypothetical protein KC442_11555 [Thermomicrobiales bacterium]|nr:hypothetical protein [Thermomicrobiales bacterium]
MSAGQAAAELARDGLDTVLVRNAIDPLPNSGVDQLAYLAAAGGTPLPSDRAWSDALKAAGLQVLQTTALFFDPELVERFPDARPIDATGVPSAGFDWYLGVCPTHEGYLAAKVARLVRVTEELEPDGLFLSFTRFPGFWENWLPDYRFTPADQFCFCDRCRSRFAAEADVVLPVGGLPTQVAAILAEHAAAWHAWRARVIQQAIARIRGAVAAERPGFPVMLNTLPFPASDYGGADVRRVVAAQDLALLSDVIDRFELMTYLQILRRPDSWLTPVLDEARARAPQRQLLCTLQVAPLYTEGAHAGRGRAAGISAAELAATARAALAAGADGLVFYHWTDFLEDEAQGGRKRAVLREVTGA